MRTPNIKRQSRTSREKEYLLSFELGLVVTLLVLLGTFKLNIKTEKEHLVFSTEQEVVLTEEIVQTKHEERIPPPPRPVVPIEVSNDEIIEDDIAFNLDSELDLDSALELPAPPPSAEKEEAEDEPQVFVIVERMPELIGGMASLQQHISYPEISRMAGIEGRVIVEFIIDERGQVLKPKVVRGIGGGCDEEALQAVQKVKFKPGMQRGKPVRVRYTMPVLFKLGKAST